MKFHMSRGILAAAAAAVVAGVTLATPASAAIDPPAGGWDHTWYSTDSAHGATLFVEEYNDVLEVCDSASDGLGAEAKISGGGVTHTLSAKGGYGDCTETTSSSFDLPEGATISITVYLLNSAGNHLNATTSSYVNDH